MADFEILMHSFEIVTDSSADLDGKMVEKLGVHVLPLSFTMDGKTYHNYPDNREMEPRAFFEKLRAGDVSTTSAVNVSQYVELVEPMLRAGKDVLILAFSSGLSATYNSSRMAVEELKVKYPNRKLYTVDTLCASLGQGLLVCLAARERSKGKSIDEVFDWVVARKLSICHEVTVDDLMFLKRGGRISATTAVVGSMLQIKPIIYLDDEGKLENIGKARGRQASFKTLVDRMEQRAVDPQDQTVFIVHGDCLDEAEQVARMIRERLGVKDFYINYVGPVIGSHTGPGLIAVFYVGTKR